MERRDWDKGGFDGKGCVCWVRGVYVGSKHERIGQCIIAMLLICTGNGLL